MKHVIIEVYEDKYGEFRSQYICVDESQNSFMYTNTKIDKHTKFFDTEEEAVEWGNQNIVPVRNGRNLFKVVNMHEKDIFVARLEG